MPARTDPAAAVRKFNETWRKGEQLHRLRRKANRFDTPTWARPYWRMRVKWFLFRHYRHVRKDGV